MLIRAPASDGAPDSECQTDLHTVVPQDDGPAPRLRRAGLGRLQAAVPSREELPLKPPGSWAIHRQGHGQLRPHGHRLRKAPMAWMPVWTGMVYASIAHPPVFGGR